MIEEPFIHFNSASDFFAKKRSASADNTTYKTGSNLAAQTQVGTPDIPWQAIVFIKDLGQYWTHGKLQMEGNMVSLTSSMATLVVKKGVNFEQTACFGASTGSFTTPKGIRISANDISHSKENGANSTPLNIKSTESINIVASDRNGQANFMTLSAGDSYVQIGSKYGVNMYGGSNGVTVTGKLMSRSEETEDLRIGTNSALRMTHNSITRQSYPSLTESQKPLTIDGENHLSLTASVGSVSINSQDDISFGTRGTYMTFSNTGAETTIDASGSTLNIIANAVCVNGNLLGSDSSGGSDSSNQFITFENQGAGDLALYAEYHHPSESDFATFINLGSAYINAWDVRIGHNYSNCLHISEEGIFNVKNGVETAFGGGGGSSYWSANNKRLTLDNSIGTIFLNSQDIVFGTMTNGNEVASISIPSNGLGGNKLILKCPIMEFNTGLGTALSLNDTSAYLALSTLAFDSEKGLYIGERGKRNIIEIDTPQKGDCVEINIGTFKVAADNINIGANAYYTQLIIDKESMRIGGVIKINQPAGETDSVVSMGTHKVYVGTYDILTAIEDLYSKLG